MWEVTDDGDDLWPHLKPEGRFQTCGSGSRFFPPLFPTIFLFPAPKEYFHWPNVKMSRLTVDFVLSSTTFSPAADTQTPRFCLAFFVASAKLFSRRKRTEVESFLFPLHFWPVAVVSLLVPCCSGLPNKQKSSSRPTELRAWSWNSRMP